MKILFLTPYPIKSAPSQRFRFEHFLAALAEQDKNCNFHPFLSISAWGRIYSASLIRILDLFAGYYRRILVLFRIPDFDIIFIHRELSPFGPPIFEWLIAKVFRKKIIYDFDDAIWMNDGHDSSLTWWLKCRWKIQLICKWSWKVSVGNGFLAEYARQFNQNVELIPTVVDTEVHKPSTIKNQHEMVKIGWTGSHSTLFYLEMIVPLLHKLERTHEFEFVVIANRDPKLDLKFYRFVPWSKETEIEDLNMLDIGVMPLEDDEWSRGKCGFKLIQYGAMGVPSIASTVGVNVDIIQHDQNGFLADSTDDWEKYMVQLIENTYLRQEMGNNARRSIEENYSVKAVNNKFLGLFLDS